jgi:hypothetical protein
VEMGAKTVLQVKLHIFLKKFFDYIPGLDLEQHANFGNT